MAHRDSFDFDVFISYAKQDRVWVECELLPRLIENGLKPCIDFMNFQPGKFELSEIERGIKTSRKTLLIISPEYLKDNLSEFENHLTRHLGLTAREIRCIPIIISACRLPDNIKYLVSIDLSSKNIEERNKEWERLIKGLSDVLKGTSPSKKRSSHKVKYKSLSQVEKELRMNKEHWVSAGFSMPADQFNFTAVYFDNQVGMFKKLRIEVNALADEIATESTKTRQSSFLKKCYDIIDALISRTNQVVDLLETDTNHPQLLIVKKAALSSVENLNKARRSLMKSSISGTLNPGEFNSTANHLPIELQAIVISIEELEKHLCKIYQIANVPPARIN